MTRGLLDEPQLRPHYLPGPLMFQRTCRVHAGVADIRHVLAR
jgi:hypothetical protein